MRLILLLFINWLSTIINSYSFSYDDRNQESIQTQSEIVLTVHSSPLRSVHHRTTIPLTAVPTTIPKKQRQSPFGLKLSVIE